MEKKIALITGATSGIGAAYAERYAKDGYDLIITGRREEKINALAASLRAKCAINAEVALLDFSDDTAVDNFIEKLSNKPIEVLVNNAGFGYNSLFYKSDISRYEKMIDTHVTVPMKLTRAVLPGMVKRNSGTIINVSSDGIYLLVPKNGIYSATKAFMKVFTEELRLDLMDTNIKIQVLIPGLTDTDFHEKMGMDSSKKVSKGIVHWMDPRDVVEISMKDLQKNKVVCIPGFANKMMIRILNLFPRKQYYKMMYQISQKL